MTIYEKEEAVPMLCGEQTESGLTGVALFRRHERPRRYTILLLGSVIFTLFNAAMLYASTWKTCNDPCRPDFGSRRTAELFSPAYDAIRYNITSLDFHPERTAFIGEPREELDTAWADLLKPSSMRVSNEEMAILEKSSVILRDGTGYVGYLEVFHQLHCLKRIYQWEYREYYEDLETEGRTSLRHWEHCLEVLRQSLMCRPDLTVNTIEEASGPGSKLRGVTSDPRRCVDWPLFKAWADERALPHEIHDIIVEGAQMSD